MGSNPGSLCGDSLPHLLSLKLQIHICRAAAEQQQWTVCSSACDIWRARIHTCSRFSFFLPFSFRLLRRKVQVLGQLKLAQVVFIHRQLLTAVLPLQGEKRNQQKTEEDPKESTVLGAQHHWSVSWCFTTSQPSEIISGLKTNSNSSLSYSASKSFKTNHKFFTASSDKGLNKVPITTSYKNCKLSFFCNRPS